MSATQTIPEFYRGRSVFITGSTGFMGKVLVEKLLRSCPDIKTLYLLVRPKKGKEVKDRLDEILDCKVFEKLRTAQPDFRTKVVGVSGDLLKDELGLSHSDQDSLQEDVSVVIHAAATIRFDEEMKLSVEVNIIGTRRVMELCKKMKKLEALVCVSSAMSNCDRDKIGEELYEPPLHPKKLVSAVEWMDSEVMNMLTSKMLGNRPNTYTYTKAVVEHLINDERDFLPTAIVRPSIVGAAYKEPIRGWVDTYNGPNGLLIGVGKGMLRVMKGDTKLTADFIPVDFVSNLLISVAWYTAIQRPNDLKIYNCTTGQVNNLTWGFVERLAHDNYMKTPLENLARIPSPRFTKSAVLLEAGNLFDQVLPAYIMDFYLWITGRRQMFVKLQERLRKNVSSLEYFTTHSWVFSNDNIFMLFSKMSAADRKAFYFNPKDIHWPTYFESYCLGTKQYVLKEELSGIPKARKALARMKRIHFLINLFIFIVLCRLLVKRVAIARALWDFLLGWAMRIVRKIPGFARAS